MVRFVPVDSVLGKSGLSPCIDAADTMDVQVDIQIDETATLYFVGMADTFKILFAIVPCPDAERLQTIDSKSFLPIGDTEPPHISPAAIVLRVDVFGLKFCQRHLVLPDKGASLAVGIVLPRPTPKILDASEVCWQAHPHAQLGEQGLAVACGMIIHIDQDAVVVDDGVFHRDISGLLPYG